MRHWTLGVGLFLVVFSMITTLTAHNLVLILSPDDSKEPADTDVEPTADTSSEWDDFGDSDNMVDQDLDPGSWRSILEPGDLPGQDIQYLTAMKKILSAATHGETRAMEEAVAEIESAASVGNPHAQSVLGFLHGCGMVKKKDKAKSLLYHHFAAQGGNLQSKMAVAYTYSRQDMHEEAVKLYSELAEVALNSYMVSNDSSVIEPVRIHIGTEENKDALRKSRGEEDDDFLILEYQAKKGNAAAMCKIGMFYYFGLRGLRRDNSKALKWFTKAAEKGEARAMELLGEIYARGAGVEKNYTKALDWLKMAAKQQLYSAYNGMGYLYVKGYGVEKRNYTNAKILFEKAVAHKDPGGHYNLGVMYLKGIGVKKDVKKALTNFIFAANAEQPKAYFQLAKMFQTGYGFEKSIPMATALYKLVAERGPWSSLSRWALESYMKGDLGKALLLYSRMAELGYEIAQSNAAWILEKYGERSMCMGESGLCTDAERFQRSHSLWWKASEQGNEHAALLIGDAYYYGRGTSRDYKVAAEAYKHARSQSNAQAMFNLGYMYEHGQGLPFDLHLAKRFYDEALLSDRSAKLPVSLALASLWIRTNYADSFMVRIIDSLPNVYPKIETWVEEVIMEEGNATILTLFVCLLTVLYLRERQRRHGAADPPQPNNNDNANAGLN